MPEAPVRRAVLARRDGFVTRIDVRALGLAVVALGGGCARPGDAVDPRVGLAEVASLGAPLRAGEPLAWIHAADDGTAHPAAGAVLGAMAFGDEVPAASPLLVETLLG